MRRLPIYEKSPHIIHNERTVTKIKGVFRNQPISCYVVQIAGGSVNGIDSYVHEGALVEKGHIFGMIRIGSQVDVIITRPETMNIKVRPGEKARAGDYICGVSSSNSIDAGIYALEMGTKLFRPHFQGYLNTI